MPKPRWKLKTYRLTPDQDKRIKEAGERAGVKIAHKVRELLIAWADEKDAHR